MHWKYVWDWRATHRQSRLQQALKHAHIPLEQIFAFGDDSVDIAMLKLCGKGIAMGNAISAVKAIAGEVIGSNDEDGAAQFLLERYFVESFW